MGALTCQLGYLSTLELVAQSRVSSTKTRLSRSQRRRSRCFRYAKSHLLADFLLSDGERRQKCAGAGFSGAPANASVAPASPSARGISGGSTIARAVRYGVGKRAGAAPVSISSPKATAPIEVSPPRPAAPSVASVTATGLISQSTNPAINLIKSQTSTSSTTKLDCTNLRALSSVIKVF